MRCEHEERKGTYSYVTVRNGSTELFIVATLHLHLDPFQLNQTYQLTNCYKNFTRRLTNDSVQLLHCRENAFLDICVLILKGYHSHFISSLTKVMRDWPKIKKTIHWFEHWGFLEGSQLNTSAIIHLPESKIKTRQSVNEEKEKDRK